tara:strand:+ start:642 stop:746 length:105 start_codon:yes stop_codon:yes gene_type:complete
MKGVGKRILKKVLNFGRWKKIEKQIEVDDQTPRI